MFDWLKISEIYLTRKKYQTFILPVDQPRMIISMSHGDWTACPATDGKQSCH